MSEQAMDTLPAIVVPALDQRDPFCPSEYTGLLMHALRSRAHFFAKGKGLDMGVGSGVLLGTLGLLGVRELYGVDVDPEAIGKTRLLMRNLGFLDRTRLLLGSLWEPLGEEKFDVVAANLPHFPTSEPPDPRRPPTWSVGGPDGRNLLDPFLAGLRQHLTDAGVAFITHDSFLGLQRTSGIAAEHGLQIEVACATTSLIPAIKVAKLPPDLRADATSGISTIGCYAFTEVQILEIRPANLA